MTRRAVNLGGRTLKKIAWFFALTLASSLQASAAIQAKALSGHLLAFDIQGVEWKAPERSTLFGVEVWYRYFSSNDALGTIAAGLASNDQRFQRFVVHTGRLILSGIENGNHWLADLSDQGSGVSGYVSVMPFRERAVPTVAAGLNAGNSSEVDPHVLSELLPSGSTRILQHQSSDSAVRQEIYRVPLPWQSLSAYLERALRSDGWHLNEGGLLANGPNFWSRGQARMMLSLRTSGQGSTLYVHHMN